MLVQSGSEKEEFRKAAFLALQVLSISHHQNVSNVQLSCSASTTLKSGELVMRSTFCPGSLLRFVAWESPYYHLRPEGIASNKYMFARTCLKPIWQTSTLTNQISTSKQMQFLRKLVCIPTAGLFPWRVRHGTVFAIQLPFEANTSVERYPAAPVDTSKVVSHVYSFIVTAVGTCHFFLYCTEIMMIWCIFQKYESS